ncbi:MAG TPA: XdhC family protein [Stellaceae bacterium]|nr:XdhC family protein [Stellaceae bacterium]
MKRAFLDRALAVSRSGCSAALVTHLISGQHALIEGESIEGDLKLESAALGAARAAIRDDRSTTVESTDGRLFVEVFNPPLRLIVVGAVHAAQPLARVAAIAGYAVTIVDPRSAFATEERFPGVALSTDWPDEAVPRLKPDRRTAVVTLTHDPKIDDPALTVALKSDAFYIGALGSKRTHAGRCQRLKESGFEETDLARIHGPVGLSIGALTPAEIAVSILAEITQTLRADRIKERAAA